MDLREVLRPVSGNKRKFLLLRIADISTEQARQIVGITKGTFNTWCQDQNFVSIQRRRDELSAECKQQSIQILRRDNQLEAVFLEGKIIQKLKEEIESGDYNLMRTHLAREVYSKLITDLDQTPVSKVETWEERWNRMAAEARQTQTAIPGVVVDGQFTEVSQPTEQLPQGQTQADPEPSDNEAEAGTEEAEEAINAANPA